jgi:hypothetical protein
VVDDSDQGLCNIESSASAGSNGSFRNGYRSAGPAPAGRKYGQETTEKPAINHADAPQDAVRRFGTDLAQWVLRENCAG